MQVANPTEAVDETAEAVAMLNQGYYAIDALQMIWWRQSR